MLSRIPARNLYGCVGVWVIRPLQPRTPIHPYAHTLPHSDLNHQPSIVNYRRLLWAIVVGVFALFFVTDVIEHAVLPQYHLGRVGWFLTTALATVLSYPVARIVLYRLEASHNRLILQNQELQEQSSRLAQESERLALAVQEAHHRIKNNLQSVASLLMWQQRQEKSTQEIITDSVNRIRAIATVHDLLTRDSQFDMVNAGDVVRRLGSSLLVSMEGEGEVVMDVAVEDVFTHSRAATSIALIVTELILNALKHGFPNHGAGKIRVKLSRENGVATLRVSDDGVGLPEGFDLERDAGTGLNIATSLAREDLDGAFNLAADQGTTATVTFKT